VKIIFFSILIFNTVFFLWEMRKGAPDIYTEQHQVIALESEAEQIIFLDNELNYSEIEAASMAEVENNRASLTEDSQEEIILAAAASDTVVIPAESSKEKDLQLIIEPSLDNSEESPANVLVNEAIDANTSQEEISQGSVEVPSENTVTIIAESTESTESTEQQEIIQPAAPEENVPSVQQPIQVVQLEKDLCFKVLQANKALIQEQLAAYSVSFFVSTEQYISHYFLLTGQSASIAEMKANAQGIKQEGLDVWVIEKGEFERRISLGVFSKVANVNNAKAKYMQAIQQELEIVPRYKEIENYYFRVSLGEAEANELLKTLGEYQVTAEQCLSK